MSVSTDKNAAIVTSGRIPDVLFPTVGKNAKEESSELKLAYPEFVLGKRRRISAADRDIYQFYMAAAAHYEEQKALAVNRIRTLLCDAEYGVTGRGIIFVERRKFPKKGFYTKPAQVDALYPIKN